MLSKNFQIQIGFSLIFHIKYIKDHKNSKLPFKDVSNQNILILTSDTKICNKCRY